MDELFDLLVSEDAGEFMWFIDDYYTACEDISWGFNRERPFMQQLAYVMKINSED